MQIIVAFCTAKFELRTRMKNVILSSPSAKRILNSRIMCSIEDLLFYRYSDSPFMEDIDFEDLKALLATELGRLRVVDPEGFVFLTHLPLASIEFQEGVHHFLKGGGYWDQPRGFHKEKELYQLWEKINTTKEYFDGMKMLDDYIETLKYNGDNETI